METPRYLRVTLPPFVFWAAVILAHVLNSSLVNTLKEWKEAEILTVMAAIVAGSIIPAGFVLGGITRLVFWGLEKITWRKRPVVGQGRYDLLYERKDTDPLLDDLKVKKPGSADDHLNAARTFLYEARDKWWLADYMNRCWDASMAYSGSMVALVLAAFYFVVWVTPKCWWWLLIAAGMFLIFWGACFVARKEIENVVTFQIRHKNSIPKAVAQWKAPT